MTHNEPETGLSFHSFTRRPLPGDIRNLHYLGHRVDFMWQLFHALPGDRPRLEKTHAAALRIDVRRSIQTQLPQRCHYQSTVDYYEAAMPLILARKRFLKYMKPGAFMYGVHRAIAALRLEKLF